MDQSSIHDKHSPRSDLCGTLPHGKTDRMMLEWEINDLTGNESLSARVSYEPSNETRRAIPPELSRFRFQNLPTGHLRKGCKPFSNASLQISWFNRHLQTGNSGGRARPGPTGPSTLTIGTMVHFRYSIHLCSQANLPG